MGQYKVDHNQLEQREKLRHKLLKALSVVQINCFHKTFRKVPMHFSFKTKIFFSIDSWDHPKNSITKLTSFKFLKVDKHV